MGRYLIGTVVTKKGIAKKVQPADKFRKLLIAQEISFTERKLHPMHHRIDSELKNECWDRDRTSRFWKDRKTYREESHIAEFEAIEFTFDSSSFRL